MQVINAIGAATSVRDAYPIRMPSHPCSGLAQAQYRGISHYPNFPNSICQSPKQASLLDSGLCTPIFFLSLFSILSSLTKATSGFISLPTSTGPPLAYSVTTESPKKTSSDLNHILPNCPGFRGSSYFSPSEQLGHCCERLLVLSY